MGGFKHIFITILLWLTPLLAFGATTKEVKFGKVWYTHEKSNGLSYGIFHTEMDINGYKNKNFRLDLWIEYPKGKPLKLVADYAHKNSSGGYYFQFAINNLPYENSHWKDQSLKIPLTCFDALKGEHTYYFFFTVNDTETGKCYARSPYGTFVMVYNGNKASYHAPTSSGGTSTSKSSGTSTAKNDGVVRRWTTPGMMGGTSEYTEYTDGTVMCHTENQCYFCKGTKVCSVCHGTGGTYNSYTQLYYPCGSCMQSGQCKYCNGSGVQHTYTRTDKYGNGVSTGNNNMGPVYHSSGGSSGSHSSGSSGSKSSNSDRYGYRDCPTCYGTGNCQTCGGSGVADSYYTGGYMACPNCKSNRGKCQFCNGTGKRYGLK